MIQALIGQREIDPDPHDTAADRAPGLRLMPSLEILDSEPLWKRGLFLLLAGGFLVAYFGMLTAYWAPAHPGINQNAYMVGGKFLAERGTNGINPSEPYVFLGWMWNLVERDVNGTKQIWYYPKYPIGMNALFAACLKASQWTTGDWEAGKIWAFWINPVTMTLAMGAMFMLVRQVAGSFMGFMGMMILAFSQVTLQFAEQPLSHGPALCAVTWGMYWLLRWWQTGSWWRGVFAGLSLGYAVTTRYTEGLLVLPIAAATIAMVRYDAGATRWWSLAAWVGLAVAGVILNYTRPAVVEGWRFAVAVSVLAAGLGSIPLFQGEFSDLSRKQWWWGQVGHWVRIVLAALLVWVVARVEIPPRAAWEDFVSGVVAVVLFKLFAVGAIAMLYLIPWSRPRGYVGTIWPALAWAVPVGGLIAFNYATFDSFSGYDSTNESTAFTWKTFNDKWDDTVQQMYDYSMFLIPPLALAGMVMLFRRSWRAGLLVLLWLLPGFALYTAYYFGKQRPGMWYLRFFLTIFPPMVMAAMWLLKSAFDGARAGVGRGNGSVAVPIGVGVFTFCSCAVGLTISLPTMERDCYANTNLAYTCQQIVRGINFSRHNDPEVIVNDKPVKTLPVVFAEGRANINGPLCNMLQFALDAELYPSDGFGARGPNWRGEVDPNAPNPLQAARQDYMIKLLRSKTEADMVKEQNRIMRDALNDFRPVFAVLQPGSVGAFRKFITPEFEMTRVDQWKELARVPIERSVGPLDPGSRGMPFYPNRGAQTWQLYRITKKPPRPVGVSTTKPSTAPTTAPTTAPLALVAPATTPTGKPTSAPTTQTADASR